MTVTMGGFSATFSGADFNVLNQNTGSGIGHISWSDNVTYDNVVLTSRSDPPPPVPEPGTGTGTGTETETETETGTGTETETETETYAMLLAGLGLLNVTARRKKTGV